MRKYGGILLLAGILGAFYSAARLQSAPPMPDDVLTMDALRYEAGRWSTARYAGFALALFGGLLLLSPRGR